MNIRFVTPTIHGLLDYAAGAVLIIAPFVLGLQAISPLAHWLSVIAGAGLIVYSSLTDYSYSVAKLVPFKVHLVFDLVAGIVFVAAPFLFGFSGVTMIYYIVMGLGVFLLIAVTNPTVAETSSATSGS